MARLGVLSGPAALLTPVKPDTLSSVGAAPPKKASSILSAGSVIADRYELVRELGRGGIGEVWLARNIRVDKLVAIKTIHPRWASDDQIRERFKGEALAANRAAHSNIVQVFDADQTDDGDLFLVMEFVDGRNLHHLQLDVGAFSMATAYRIIREVAVAVRAAHAAGVVHRDLKPENVMVSGPADDPVAVKVMDFGIAAGVLGNGDEEGSASRLTAPGMRLGTPHYMAPEQGGSAEPDPRLDVYALGVILFEMITGTLPFDAPEPVHILAQKLAKPAPSLSAMDLPNVPAGIALLVDAALSTDPRGRPPDAGVFVARLDAAMAGVLRASRLGSGSYPAEGAGGGLVGSADPEFDEGESGSFPTHDAFGEPISAASRASMMASRASAASASSGTRSQLQGSHANLSNHVADLAAGAAGAAGATGVAAAPANPSSAGFGVPTSTPPGGSQSIQVIEVPSNNNRGMAIALLIGLFAIAGAIAFALRPKDGGEGAAANPPAQEQPALVAPVEATPPDLPVEVEIPPDLPAEDAAEASPEDGGEPATGASTTSGTKKKKRSGTKTGDAALPLPEVEDEGETAKASGEDCLRVEARAQDARNAHDWNSLLRYAKKRSCWKSQNERVKLLTKAYFELKRFDECAKVGASSGDSEVQRWVKICQARSEG